MAVFTYIATALVTATGLLTAGGFAFNLAVGVVAMGLATATAKLFGIFDAPKATDDPGVKIQLPPATDNKVPRLYGRNYTGGIITDAEIKEQNKKMTYVLVISEYNAGDVWTVNNVYRDDKRLVFGGSTLDSVSSTYDANQTSAESWRDTFKVRVYAGNAYAQAQIFPAAQQDDARNLFDNWTINNSMEDLVFAVVEVLYNDNQGVFGLGSFTFDLTNSVSEPSNVLLDYLQNDRYGPGITNLDMSSFTEWAALCNQSVSYYNSSNTFTTRPRYRINGALSMFDTVKDNISKICQNGGAFFTFNSKTGNYGVVPLRAATTEEKANAWTFDNAIITSKVQITSTELFSLYNQMTVEYPSVAQRDQTSTVYVDTPTSQRHPNEPDNPLNFKLMMTNSRSQAYNLANIDLRQGRLSQIIQFTADYSALQVDVGDVVKVDLAEYGWSDKLFRVMRLRELEDADGALSVECTLLEYADSVYAHTIEADDLDLTNTPTGINDLFSLPYVVNGGFGYTNIANIFVLNDPESGNLERINPVTGTVEELVPMSIMYPDYWTPLGQYPQTIFELTLPGEGTYDTAILVTEGPAGNIRSTVNAPPGLFFPANGNILISQDTFSFDSGNVNFNVNLYNSQTGLTSNVITVGNVLIDMSNAIPSAKIKNLAVTTAKIDDLAVNTAKIDDLAVTNAKIANLAVNTLQIGNFAVTVPATITNTTPISMDAVVGTYPNFTDWTALLTMTYELTATGLAVQDTDIPVLITWSVEADAQNNDANQRYFRLLRSSTESSVSTDTYFANVQLLLPCNGTNQSTTFTDISSYNRTITRTGNVEISTSRSKWGGASAYFPGSGAWLYAPTGTGDFGTTNFTIEGWFSWSSLINGGLFHVYPGTPGGTTAGLALGYDGTDFQIYTNSSTYARAYTPTVNTWYHIALVKNSGSLRLYVNGVAQGTAITDSVDYGGNGLNLGLYYGNTTTFAGYIDDFRVTKNIARYTANFTPPTTSFPGQGQAETDPYWSSTVLLGHFDGSPGDTGFVADYSSGGNALVLQGNAVLSDTQKVFGPTSVYLPGNANSIVTTNSANSRFDLGNVTASTNFTAEFRVRADSVSATDKIIMCHALPGSGGDGIGGWQILENSGTLYFNISKTSSAGTGWVASYKTNASVITANTWHAVSLVISSGVPTWFVDGVIKPSVFQTPNSNYASSLIGIDTTRTDYNICIGSLDLDSTNNVRSLYYTGYLDEVRLTSGVARYTANYTPSATAFSNDPGTLNTQVLYQSFEGSRDLDQFCSGIYLDSIAANVEYTYALEGCGRTGDDQVHQRAMWITAARR